MENFSMKNFSLQENTDFPRAINCTRKLTYVCACACACDCTRLGEQYGSNSYANAWIILYQSRKTGNTMK